VLILRRPSGALTSILFAVGLGLAACGQGPSPTSSPSRTLLQQQYLAAANAYNVAEAPIAQAEASHCNPTGPTADLAQCQTALAQDRQATRTFDRAIRAINFESAQRGDVAKLLANDSALETLLQQGAAASSLTAATPLFAQIAQRYSEATTDADRLRTDLGLPATTPPATPST